MQHPQIDCRRSLPLLDAPGIDPAVPFDELAGIDESIDDLYAECERHCDSCALAGGCLKSKTKSTSFTLQDADYINVRKK